jgi:hypothetical protein
MAKPLLMQNCWLWRIVVQAETLELVELTRPQCDNSIRVCREACHIDKVEKAARGSDTLYEATFSQEQRELDRCFLPPNRHNGNCYTL